MNIHNTSNRVHDNEAPQNSLTWFLTIVRVIEENVLSEQYFLS